VQWTKLNKRVSNRQIVEFINGVADKSDLLAERGLEGKAGELGGSRWWREDRGGVLESAKEIRG
jgi:hypothetical protein